MKSIDLTAVSSGLKDSFSKGEAPKKFNHLARCLLIYLNGSLSSPESCDRASSTPMAIAFQATEGGRYSSKDTTLRQFDGENDERSPGDASVIPELCL